MRTVVAALCGALSLVAIPGPAARAADPIPAREAATFVGTELPVREGQSVGLVCTAVATSRQGHFLGAIDVTDGDSARVTNALVALRLWGETYVVTRTPAEYGGHGEHTVTEGSFEGRSLGAGVGTAPLERGGTMRVAAAAWGFDDFECVVVVDGGMVATDWTALPVERATYALATDFEGGHAAAANGCVPATTCVAAGVAASQTLSRTTEGHSFGLFLPGAGLVQGSVDAPGRETRTLPDVACVSAVPPRCLDFVSTSTPGTWTFALDTQATLEAGPVVMLLDVPA